MDAQPYCQVRGSLHNLKSTANAVTEHIKTHDDGKGLHDSGWTGAGASQSPFPTHAKYSTVFITEANFKAKTGKFHNTADCRGLTQAISKIEAYDLVTVLDIPRHKFNMCKRCKNKAI